MSAGKPGVVLAALTLFLPAMSKADEEGLPIDYTRVTSGGKYVFVMLCPRTWRRFAYDYAVYSDPSSQKRTEKVGKLQSIYPASGLYRNDGSKKPLWTVDWYSFGVWPCSDGEHIIRWGPWARKGDKGQTVALAFYRAGKEVKSYRVTDLIADYTELPSSVSHYQWAKQTSFDDVGKRVKVQLWKGDIRPMAGRTLIFDIRTGASKTIGG